MLHPGLQRRALAELHANPQSLLQVACDLLRPHQRSGLLLSRLPQNIVSHMRNHLFQYIPAPKLNSHTKPGDPHQVHRRDHQIRQESRPMPADALHLSQGFRSPSRLRHQDLLQRYSFSVNINSSQRLYKLQSSVRVPLLSPGRL